jgi:serine/threonine protein phosphatase 1
VNIFVVGDIHGCYYTFKNLLQKYWDAKNDLLIQVGDLIDRGNFSAQTIKFCRELEFNHKAVFLKGNHELMAINYFSAKGFDKWHKKYGKSLLWQYHLEELDFENDLNWLRQMPIKWENDSIFISHAGISYSENYLDENDSDGLLWNKSSIKKINKIQVIGHSPHENKKPIFIPEQNVWNVDTGAYLGNYLSALKLDDRGNFIDFFSVSTSNKDIF